MKKYFIILSLALPALLLLGCPQDDMFGPRQEGPTLTYQTNWVVLRTNITYNMNEYADNEFNPAASTNTVRTRDYITGTYVEPSGSMRFLYEINDTGDSSDIYCNVAHLYSPVTNFWTDVNVTNGEMLAFRLWAKCTNGLSYTPHQFRLSLQHEVIDSPADYDTYGYQIPQLSIYWTEYFIPQTWLQRQGWGTNNRSVEYCLSNMANWEFSPNTQIIGESGIVYLDMVQLLTVKIGSIDTITNY